MKKKFVFNLLLMLIIFCSACVNTKKVTYFINQGDAEITATNLPAQPLIQNNELLSISVSSLSSQSSSTFNAPNFTATTAVGYSGMQLNASGYLVSNDGYIKFPILGAIKVTGITETDLETLITKALIERKLLLEPIVTVRNLNFKVTVLGEVGRPTVINVPNEKISLMEAIGMAGDLSIYARRDNVLLIREENGKKITRRLNLNSNDILNSPYYYLKSNDVVYVEPNKAKVASVSRSREILPVVFGALSFGVVLLDRLTR